MASWGASGVDIFFVISGFVMAHTTRDSTDAVTFFRKRIARIVPLYWIALLWTARHALPSPDADLLKDFFFVPHWSTEFPNSVNPILRQGFTLNYEMFFYALFALAMIFGRKRVVVLLCALFCVPSSHLCLGVPRELSILMI
jgi:exopolysaccharide production protein ExoZ